MRILDDADIAGFKERIDPVVASLRTKFPTLWSDCGAWSNDAFPFSMYLSLIVGDPRTDEEDVVWCANIHIQPESRLRFAYDLTRGNGEFLTDWHEEELDAVDPDETTLWARRMMSSALMFLEQSVPLIEDVLADAIQSRHQQPAQEEL